MRRTIYSLAIFVFLTGCGEKSETWQGVYYPNGSDMTLFEDLWIRSPNFLTKEECETWGMEITYDRMEEFGVSVADDYYECGKNCRWNSDVGVSVCTDSEKEELNQLPSEEAAQTENEQTQFGGNSEQSKREIEILKAKLEGNLSNPLPYDTLSEAYLDLIKSLPATARADILLTAQSKGQEAALAVASQYIEESYPSTIPDSTEFTPLEIEILKTASSAEEHALIKRDILRKRMGFTGGEDINDQLQDDCLQRLSDYNSCMIEYNTDLAEYNTCEIEKATEEYKKHQYCSKPFNFCGIKPNCT